MKQLNRIPDEVLAAYLEGMLSSSDAARVETAMDIDTMEVLNVARRAMDEMPSGEIVDLPQWNDSVPFMPFMSQCHPMAMAGFLGDGVAEDEFDEDENED